MAPTKRQANPNNLVKSRCNMRTDEPTLDDDWFSDIVQNVEEEGVKVKPIVRMEDDDYAVVDGWHRVRAAQEAKLDTLDIDFRADMSDAEALKVSFTGNEDYFQRDIDPLDRAIVLGNLWEEVGDGGKPSPTQLGGMISVPKATVSKWLEPFRHEWEETAFDPTSDTLQDFAAKQCQEIGIRKLRSIRKTTGGGDDGEWLAEQTYEEDLTIQDLAQVRDYHEKGADLEDAVKAVTGELDFEDLVDEPEDDEPEHPTTESEGVFDVDESTDDTNTVEQVAATETEPDVAEAELADGGTTTDGSDSSWFDDYEPLSDEEKEETFPDGWEDDGEETEASETEGHIEVTVEFDAKAPAVQEAAEDLHVNPPKLIDIAMEKYLKEGHYI